METLRQPRFTKRYDIVTEEKAGGAVYTPKLLADFVSGKIVEVIGEPSSQRPLRLLDPAVGQGELLISLLEHLPNEIKETVEVCGFETDSRALDIAKKRIQQKFPSVSIHFTLGNFLNFVLDHFGSSNRGDLFCPANLNGYDLVIANPPYVRTQILGTAQAQILSEQFGLTGRVDLCYAFILGISQILKPHGIAGIIVSNRFMTTKSGACVRQALIDRLNIHNIWDFGDTKLFEAAVLPAVLLVQGKYGNKLDAIPAFTSIYQTNEPAIASAIDPISALKEEGVVEINDGRHFHIRHGKLDTNGKTDGVWRVATDSSNAWLRTVQKHSWGTFRNIGKIRVGVKTCADKIFIRNDWNEITGIDRPELLRTITTHRVARRYRALISDQPSHILYPHEVVRGRRRAVDLTRYPRSLVYLEKHRTTLEARKYVIEAGRQWYEIWVPQDPNAWDQPKLVFRDIAEKPTFWIDTDGSVVNGDCYWLIAQNPANSDLLWLAAAIANSTFIEHYYDHCFHNKLYAGRRRFMTQYVENFPLPDPELSLSKAIITKAKRIHMLTPSLSSDQKQQEINSMVWEALTGYSSSPN